MLTRPRSRVARDEQGAIAIMFALLSVLLLLMAGLVVDLGLARDTARSSQNAADASALAGANVLYPSSGACTLDTAPATAPCFLDAVKAAQDYATVNFDVTAADWNTCTDTAQYYVPTGQSPCISFTDDALGTGKPAQPTKVRVVVPVRTVKTLLGGLAGVSQIDLSRAARVALTPGTARSCGLCLLGTGVSGLGNGDVIVTGGSVHSNGTIDSGPNGVMRATPSPNSISVSGTCPGHCDPVATTGVPTIADPYLNSITLPLDMTGLQVKTDPCSQGPGKYAATGIPNSTCTLAPGLYVLTGVWGNQNNTVLRGTGVTIYGTCGTPATPTVCTAGQVGGSLNTKNGNVQITAPTSGVLQGFAIVYDRLNAADLNIQGNGNSAVTGAVYAPKAQLQFPGTSCVTITNGPVIVNDLYGNGNTGCVNLVSSIGASIPAPPSGANLDQ